MIIIHKFIKIKEKWIEVSDKTFLNTTNDMQIATIQYKYDCHPQQPKDNLLEELSEGMQEQNQL